MRQGIKKTLVLNADYRPLPKWPMDIVTAREAFETVYRGAATVVEEWPDEFFHSPSAAFPVPKTIVLHEYVKVHGSPKFCRQSVLLRDRFRCQYCGKSFAAPHLTYDHVKPRSHGGRTVWANIVMACEDCNLRKRDHTCKEAGMWPITAPRAPTSAELLRAGLELLPNEVRQTWPEFLYWNVELKP
jgi:5-methylcytosine-specific restriction endonuclease McrA